MADNFYKTLHWFIISFLIIIGIYALLLAEGRGSIRPTMIAVISMGIAFILTAFWKEMRGKVILITFFLLVFTGYASRYFTDVFYILTGMIVDLHMVLEWGILLFIFGVPIMMFAIPKWGES